MKKLIYTVVGVSFQGLKNVVVYDENENTIIRFASTKVTRNTVKRFVENTKPNYKYTLSKSPFSL